MNTKPSKQIEAKVGVSKIAIDMHLADYRVVRQQDYSAPQPAQKFTPEKFYQWLERELAAVERVVVCYEAGCFGYEPARRMQRLGAEVLVIAPQNWDEEHKHQVNDRFDAQVMCRRLSEYLSGHRRALSVVRMPSPEQEAERAQARYREQLRKEIRRMQARGRSLLLARGLPVRGRWWKGRLWTWIEKEMPRWVVTQLAGWQSLLLEAERQVLAVEAELAAAAPAGLFFGEGRLTHELLRRELLDPQRFQNPRQVGSYYGLCPSESTSGPRQRRGPITKHGHPRLRRLLVELAWRVARSQPHYRPVVRWRPILASKASPSARKKAIVAVARCLAVDLWRLACGRVTLAELGLQPKVAAPVHPITAPDKAATPCCR
jgi:transposase